ncbi:MAG: hypothetical protein Ta2A_24540 [Treponemataceae bacterium]|nr:MAG: hypothetical protein Ta2A_24540 [Treponemataceae bacterium]
MLAGNACWFWLRNGLCIAACYATRSLAVSVHAGCGYCGGFQEA